MSTLTSVQLNAAAQLNGLFQFAERFRDENALVNFDAQTGRFQCNARDRIRSITNFWTVPGRNVDANNATRAAFRQMLLDVFDAKDFAGLPPTVRSVLKEGNFDGTGKPLSVRRIKMVMTAVGKTDAFRQSKQYAVFSDIFKEPVRLDPDPQSGLDVKDPILKSAKRFIARISDSKGGNLMGVLAGIGGQATDTAPYWRGLSLLTELFSALDNRDGIVRIAGRKGNECLKIDLKDNPRPGIDALFDLIKERIREASNGIPLGNPASVAENRDKTLREVFAELDKVADRLKILLSAYANPDLDLVPGKTQEEKVNGYIRFASVGEGGYLPVNDKIEAVNMAIAIVKDLEIPEHLPELLANHSSVRNLNDYATNARALKEACGTDRGLFLALLTNGISKPKLLNIAQEMTEVFKREHIAYPTDGTPKDNLDAFIRRLTRTFVSQVIIQKLNEGNELGADDINKVLGCLVTLLVHENNPDIQAAIRDSAGGIGGGLYDSYVNENDKLGDEFYELDQACTARLEKDPDAKTQETQEMLSRRTEIRTNALAMTQALHLAEFLSHYQVG